MPPAMSAEWDASHPKISITRSWAAFNPTTPVSCVPARNFRTGQTKSWAAFDLTPPAATTVIRDLRGLLLQPAALGYLLVCLLLPAIAVSGIWALPSGRIVHVSVDGHTSTFNSFRPTVGGVLASRKIALHQDDLVIPAPETQIWPGVQISVIRPVPATLTIGGAARPVWVAAQTVGGALERLGVPVDPLDRVYPGRASALSAGLRITVERREYRTWMERSEIPFPAQVLTDSSLWRGMRLVREPGRPGFKERRLRALYADGRPVDVTPLAWTVVQTPMPRVTAVGTRARIASRGQFAGREYMIVEATAYYPGPNNYGGGVGTRTATGMLAQRGVVAVDPSVIRLGSRLYIEGYGYAIAGDTGGAIKGLRIDLCYNTYDEAITFGRRQATVYILDNHN